MGTVVRTGDSAVEAMADPRQGLLSSVTQQSIAFLTEWTYSLGETIDEREDYPMPLVAAYHRPTSLEEALSLLQEPNRVVLAGGTSVNADREPSDVEVVDLQSLALNGVTESDGQVRIGSTMTLAEVSESELMPPLVRRAAVAETPSTLRTLSTVGGTVAAGGADSLLLAALLVHEAQVQLFRSDDKSLAEVLADGVPRSAIITSVSINQVGEGDWCSTGRTPADVPIVAAVARQTPTGPIVALTGVAASPVIVDRADPTADLEPPGDFRGSSPYRLELARVLTARVVEVLS